jgi:hypothetical protein
MVHDMQESTSAERFVEELEKHRSPEQREKYERHFQTGEGQYGEGGWLKAMRLKGYAPRSPGRPKALQQTLFRYAEAL